MQIYASVIASESLVQKCNSNNPDSKTTFGARAEYPTHPDSSFCNFYLGLLLSCRQIYNEARLLPFQLTTFTYVGNQFWRIKARLQDDQRNAIQSLCLLFCTGILEDLLFGLRGLRKVTIVDEWSASSVWQSRASKQYGLNYSAERARCLMMQWTKEGLRDDVECEVDTLVVYRW